MLGITLLFALTRAMIAHIKPTSNLAHQHCVRECAELVTIQPIVISTQLMVVGCEVISFSSTVIIKIPWNL